jgi:hypothetical protein
MLMIVRNPRPPRFDLPPGPIRFDQRVTVLRSQWDRDELEPLLLKVGQQAV